MAGHSHWAGIKHHKAAQDAKRSKYFSKYSKAIMIAAREGGGDPDKNLKLRYAVDKAKAGNMPNDSIERAIKKATGELGDVVYAEILYEGYGPGGVAILAEVVTDNRNRTAPEMRKIFSVSGGNLANPGAVSFMFDKQGLIAVEKGSASFDEVFEAAVEGGADDVVDGEDGFEITTSPQAFEPVKQALAARGWTLSTAQVSWVPQNTVTPDAELVPKVEKLLEALEDHDDVQDVYSNYEPPAA